MFQFYLNTTSPLSIPKESDPVVTSVTQLQSKYLSVILKAPMVACAEEEELSSVCVM